MSDGVDEWVFRRVGAPVAASTESNGGATIPIPIIVYTDRELTPQEETELRRLVDTVIIKDVQSPKHLLDETALFLHRIQANLPTPKRQMLERLQQTAPILAGKKVSIVDDDVRNIFALTSLLERYQMQVLYAENGNDGITMLQTHPDINVVLMDVMMPESRLCSNLAGCADARDGWV